MRRADGCSLLLRMFRFSPVSSNFLTRFSFHFLFLLSSLLFTIYLSTFLNLSFPPSLPPSLPTLSISSPPPLNSPSIYIFLRPSLPLSLSFHSFIPPLYFSPFPSSISLPSLYLCLFWLYCALYILAFIFMSNTKCS